MSTSPLSVQDKWDILTATIEIDEAIDDACVMVESEMFQMLDAIAPRNAPKPRPRPQQLDRCGSCPHGYLGGDDCPDWRCTCAA